MVSCLPLPTGRSPDSQQLGESDEQIRKWIKEMLEKTDDEVDKIFSDDVYREYYGHDREYQVSGFEQIPLEQNVQLLQVIEASKSRPRTRSEISQVQQDLQFVIL